MPFRYIQWSESRDGVIHCGVYMAPIGLMSRLALWRYRFWLHRYRRSLIRLDRVK